MMHTRLQAARGAVQAPPERCRTTAPPTKDLVAANVYLHKGTLRDFHPTTDDQPIPEPQVLTFEQWCRNQKGQSSQRK